MDPITVGINLASVLQEVHDDTDFILSLLFLVAFFVLAGAALTAIEQKRLGGKK